MWSDANFGLHHIHSLISTLQIVFIVFVSIRLLGLIEEHLVFFFSQPLSLLSLSPRVRVHPLI
jgi:hypothetical protein